MRYEFGLDNIALNSKWPIRELHSKSHENNIKTKQNMKYDISRLLEHTISHSMQTQIDDVLFPSTPNNELMYICIFHQLSLPNNIWRLIVFTPFLLIIIINMKPSRPRMLAHLKIIWQFHAHPMHQKVSRFFGSRYIGDDFFLGLNLVSFNRAVVPYEISKVNFRVETKILVSMSEEI